MGKVVALVVAVVEKADSPRDPLERELWVKVLTVAQEDLVERHAVVVAVAQVKLETPMETLQVVTG